MRSVFSVKCLSYLRHLVHFFPQISNSSYWFLCIFSETYGTYINKYMFSFFTLLYTQMVAFCSLLIVLSYLHIKSFFILLCYLFCFVLFQSCMVIHYLMYYNLFNQFTTHRCLYCLQFFSCYKQRFNEYPCKFLGGQLLDQRACAFIFWILPNALCRGLPFRQQC